MPENGTRGIRPIAEVKKSPQFKQYGSTSTRSIKNENTSDSDNQSQLYLTMGFNLLLKNSELVRDVDVKINAKLIKDNVYTPIQIYVTSVWGYYQPDLTII